ncbi:WRKY transcription factor 44 [Euphorbia lathyris]|uniref:WRKY transcription factor 44 n=1 Tax=Euphorbia lathyris TaxID=212925 RepID=UPI00331401FC
MEMKEGERVIVSKPVASRPSCSNFRSFTELLSGAINSSPPPNVSSENTFVAIRPKTVRFKAVLNPSHASGSSQAGLSETALQNVSDNVLKLDSRPTLYKPQAKLVSKTTVSLLANMGNFNASHLPSAEARIRHPNQDKQSFESQPASNFQQNIPSHIQMDQTTEPSRLSSQNQEEDPKSVACSADRPSYDGYNWRKYGQKQVKGSEYPRSYYKCTHPNCPVKKKVERSLDGQIAEIVYKGEHNHSKPPPPKRNSSAMQGLGVVPDAINAQDTSFPLWNNQPNERNEGSENQNEIGLAVHPILQSRASIDPVGNAVTSENSCGHSGECEEGSKALEADEEEPKSKRRKSENQSNEAAAQEPTRQTVPNSTDTDIVGDGFRWRKYGQKVVKGNPYPRSYYRCTGPKCNVRKYVERVSEDPGAFITTYEGKHNHEMPVRGSNSEPNNAKASTTRTKPIT